MILPPPRFSRKQKFAARDFLCYSSDMPLTVFTYHRVLPKPHPDALSIDVFERQLDYIQKHFEVLTPEEAADFIAGKFPRSRGRFAMLSFDDGWLDNWLYATPILKRRGLRAALALSAGFLHDGALREHAEEIPSEIVERRNLDAEKLAPDGDTLCYLSREEVRAMHDSGCWSIEAHGTRHLKNDRGISSIAAPANNVSAEDFEKFLRADLQNCIDEISSITGRAPQMMFWPWGHYSDASVEIVKSFGFVAQFTTAKGSVAYADSRDILPRLNAAAKWKKFTRNTFIFCRPWLARLHDIVAHTETLRKV
ncbi:MAG: polysaccharide deacetylase family protein [Opitutales bacterium]|nr:polysaccharide deacetylase family protein [Opitutales bacterium]